MSQSNGTSEARQGHSSPKLLWYIGIGAIVLVLIGVVFELRHPAATSYSAFLDQLDAGNVASVTFQGTQIQVHLKRPLSNAANTNGSAQTILVTSVPDVGDPSLISELRKQHVEIDVGSASWSSLVTRIPWPIWLFVGALLLAGLRKLTHRGKTSSEPSSGPDAMSMHPMGGMMRMVAGLFSTPKDAAKPVAADEPAEHPF